MFDELQQRYRSLVEQRRQGRLDALGFEQMLQQLRAQDLQGNWWQIDASSGGWLRWDGTAWRPATPPIAADSSLDRSSLARLRQRPQRWWDAVSVGGGAAAGYLWFTYSSVRGFSSPIPSLVLALLPAILLLWVPQRIRGNLRGLIAEIGQRVVMRLPAKRRAAILKAIRLSWPLLAITLLLLWLFGDHNPGGAEQPDLTTPLLMVGLPVLLALFRAPIDSLLIPIQPWRNRMSVFTRVGVALTLPMGCAFLLNGLGLQQYPLAHWNMVLGTLGSYAVLHEPKGRGPQQAGADPADRRSGIKGGQVVLMLLAMLLPLMLGPSAQADDCLADPFNLNDCLRTFGTAPILSGFASTIVAVLVNGGDLVLVLLPPIDATPTAVIPKDPAEELEEIKKQWQQASQGGDPNDPDYQRLKKQYDDYMDYLNQNIKQQTDAQQAAATAAVQPPGDIEYTSPDGRTTTLIYDPAKQGYVNVLTGGLIRPEDVEQWRDSQKRIQGETDAWRARNKDLVDNQLDSQSLAIKKLLQDQAQRRAALEAEIKQQRDARWQFIRDSQLNDVARGIAQGNRLDPLVKSLEWIEAAADTSIDFIDNMATFGGVNPSLTTAIKYTYYGVKGAASGWAEVRAGEVKYKSMRGASEHVESKATLGMVKSIVGDELQAVKSIADPRGRKDPLTGAVISYTNIFKKVDEDDIIVSSWRGGRPLRYTSLGAGVKSFVAGKAVDYVVTPVADFIYSCLPKSPY